MINKAPVTKIYIDGCSKGNPGESGVGVVFTRNNIAFKNIFRYIGKQTNNFAEYTALLLALQEALVAKIKHVEVFTDSQLLHRQIVGEYRVKNEAIKNLFLQAMTLIKGFKTFKIEHIPREQNKIADILANKAVKNKKSKVDQMTARSS